MATIEAEGLAKAIRAMKKFGVEVQDLKDAFSRIGVRLETGARQRAPVRSGRFKGSIKQSKRQNSLYLYGGGSKAPWAPYVEFGTRLQEAQTPMTRTLNANKNWAIDEIEKEMARLIKKVGLDA